MAGGIVASWRRDCAHVRMGARAVLPMHLGRFESVIPAKAGIQPHPNWIRAFAGMTEGAGSWALLAGTAGPVLGAIVAGLAVVTILAAPAQAGMSAADQRTLATTALRWAIDGGIPDFKLVKDPSTLIVARINLPGGPDLHLPGRKVVMLSPQRIQSRADTQGDFLYFRFDRFRGDERRATVAIALIWAVSSKSKEHYLSGGGATLEFEKHDDTWQLLPVAERWAS